MRCGANSVHRDLYPYQKVGAEFLAARQGALLADDMGIGKTAQAIAACDAVGARTVLVLTPGIARENWRREFMRWQTIPRAVVTVYGVKGLHSVAAVCADVLVLSYAALRDEKVRKHLAGMTYDALICDEAHALKEPKSVRTRAVYGSRIDLKTGIAKQAKHVWLLSGTPVLNHPGELWTHMRALWPDSLSTTGLRRSNFLERFVAFDDNGRAVGARRKDTLLDLLRPHVLRRLVAEVQTELPPLRWDHVTVTPDKLPPLPPDMVDAVAVVESAMAKASGDDEALALATADKMHLATLRRWTGVAKAAAVADLIRADRESGMGSCIVFALHTDVIATICNSLGIFARSITGKTRPDDRQTALDDFQARRLPVLVLQMSIASTALTLTAAEHVIFAESSWVPADMQQAAKRAHRIGQDRPVLARVVSLAGSIDEVVSDILVRKSRMIATLELSSRVHNVI